MTEIGYVYQHRPTAKFVVLWEYEGKIYMRYTNKLYSGTLQKHKETAEDMLKKAIDDNGCYYGHDNFLEFELRTIKVTMSFV